jgi:hypothetical protein
MNELLTRAGITMSALILLTLSVTAPGEAWSTEPAVNPAATETLKRMTDYLGNQKQFHVKTINTLEYLLDSGHRVDLDVTANVLVKRPNKIHSERKGTVVNQDFYYDGQKITLYNPAYNVYASESAPDTFESLFMYMYESLGFAVPISDLLYEDAYPLLMEDVSMAKVIGEKDINGITCDHLLFSRPGVDFQVWVSQGSKPLPCKYVVTDTTSQARVSISTLLTDWNLNPDVSANHFTFVPPKGSQEIEFLPF